MRRERLRAAYSPEMLRFIYNTPREREENLDDRLRMAVTGQLARVMAGEAQSAADLSCGEGRILAVVNTPVRYYGDTAPGWPITGPIDETISQIPKVDLFICTETVEHLDDPDTTLKAIRDKTRALVLSTPVGAWNDRSNVEHYWAWDRQAVEAMLAGARFYPVVYLELDLSISGPHSYTYGIWACK
jgi:hypothetical protein